VGVNRALNVVALQALLMSGVRNYRDYGDVAVQTHRVLATAASLDYVLMLATDSAGTRIPVAEAQRAIRDGMSRAIDDALLLLRAIVQVNDVDARAFTREGLRTVRAAIDVEKLADDDRSFALIALADDLCSQ
jgi:hypothetical protein